MRARFYFRLLCTPLLALLLSIVCYGEQLLQNGLDEYYLKANQLLSSLCPQSILDALLSGIPSHLKRLSDSFGICVCIIIIYTFLSIFQKSFGMGDGLFDTIANSLFLLCIMPPLAFCFDEVTNQLSRLCGYMLSFIPTGAMLLSASGAPLSSSVLSAASGGSVTLLQFISVSVILPCIKVLCMLYIVNLLCNELSVSSLCGITKSFCLWSTGLSFTIFSGLISISSFITSSADSVAIKGLKFGAARFIPVAGSLVSESMKTVLSASSFIKSVSGGAAIVFILYLLIPPLCTLLATKIYLGILSSLSCFGAKSGIGTFLKDIGTCINLLLALLLSCSIAFILMLCVFIKTVVVV